MLKNFLLFLVSIFICIVVAEAGLALLGLPRFYQYHSAPPQFAFINNVGTGQCPVPTYIADNLPVYVNALSQRIRFVYDANPRGYFGKDNEVDHITNSEGFRGREFAVDKPKGVVRIAFMGDSFTFGEGVRFEDTYAGKVSELLNEKYCRGGFQTRPYSVTGNNNGNFYGNDGKRFESYNFGVGGYNSVQELFALERFVLKYQPDMVVLKYDLSEAEPALFTVVPGTQQVERVPRWYEIDPRMFSARPPDGLFYKSRLCRLIWQINTGSKRNAYMLSYYNSLYQPDSRGWLESEQALRRMIQLCRQRNIPAYVVFFPMLYQLNRYPFGDVHCRVRKATEEEGAVFIDLFPLLKNIPARKLWVHPTDHHPNEIVHRIAAEAIVEKIAGRRQSLPYSGIKRLDI